MSEATISAVVLTLQVATTGTLAILVPATVLGYYLARRQTIATQLISALVALPMVLPPTAVGYVLLRIFAVDGPFGPELFGRRIDILLTWQAAAVAAAVMAMPLVVRTAKVAFEGVDPRLESMHRTLGFGASETFIRTSLPLAARGVIAGAVLGFARAMGEFGATVTVAGNIPFKTQTLSSAIYAAQQVGDHREAFVLIVVSLLLGFAALFAAERLANAPHRLRR